MTTASILRWFITVTAGMDQPFFTIDKKEVGAASARKKGLSFIGKFSNEALQGATRVFSPRMVS